MTATRSTPSGQGADRDDLVAVDRPRRARRPRASGRRRRRRRRRGRSPRRARPPAASIARSVAPQPTLMFEPSGAFASAVTSAPRRSNTPGAIAEYAPFAQSTAIRRPREVGAEVLDDVLDVAARRRPRACSTDAAARARASRGAPRSRARPRPSSLRPVPVEDLDAVVLGRVVRGRDDERRGPAASSATAGRRQHAGEHRGAARLDDPARDARPRAPAPSRACRGRRGRGRGRTRASPPCRGARRAPRSATRRRCRGRRRSRTSVWPRAALGDEHVLRHGTAIGTWTPSTDTAWVEGRLPQGKRV